MGLLLYFILQAGHAPFFVPAACLNTCIIFYFYEYYLAASIPKRSKLCEIKYPYGLQSIHLFRFLAHSTLKKAFLLEIAQITVSSFYFFLFLFVSWKENFFSQPEPCEIGLNRLFCFNDRFRNR